MKKSMLTYIIKRIVWYVKRLFGHKPIFEITSEFQEALDILENTHNSVLITGKAGTGKSTLRNKTSRSSTLQGLQAFII